MDITELLAFSAKQGASDLHLSAGLPPMIRVDGDVRRINVESFPQVRFLGCYSGGAIVGMANSRADAADRLHGAVSQGDAVRSQSQGFDKVSGHPQSTGDNQGHLAAHTLFV